jgi:hypothetical protein
MFPLLDNVGLAGDNNQSPNTNNQIITKISMVKTLKTGLI